MSDSPPTVWVCHEADYASAWVLAVYATEELAMRWLLSRKKIGKRVQPFREGETLHRGQFSITPHPVLTHD